MLASQLLYTSWKNGNSPYKGYMVYSKSTDITDEETAEILAVMKYKTPSNLPYTPTDEEIATLFPKNFAYFKLSSGRFCLALSSYVGQDYTLRWGNYLIHAYVIENAENILPLNIINSAAFRTRLTEEELNAEEAPASLPKVDFAEKPVAISQHELQTFFCSAEKVQLFKAFAQSVMDAVSNNGHISFYESHQNIRFWLGALALILPRNIISKVYFSTYVTETSNLITLSCILPDSDSTMYVHSPFGNSVSFYADRPNDEVRVSLYVNTVCAKLFDDYYSGILCANQIYAHMHKYHTDDCNLLIKLSSLQNGDLNTIKSTKELHDLLLLVHQYEPDNFSDIAKMVFDEVCLNSFLYEDDEIIAVYKLLFPCLSPAKQEDLLFIFTDRMLGKYSTGAPQTVYENIKAHCPCQWNVALKCMITENFMAHLKNHKSIYSDFLILRMWLDVYSQCQQDSLKESVYSRIKPIYRQYVISGEYDTVSLILSSCQAVSIELRSAIFCSITETDPELFNGNPSSLFSYLSLSLNEEAAFWSVLLQIIHRYPSMYNDCVEKYVTLVQKHPHAKKALSSLGEKNGDIQAFLDITKSYEYCDLPVNSIKDLVDGYKMYVLIPYIDVCYEEKVVLQFLLNIKNFFSSASDKEIIQNGIYLYKQIAAEPAPEKIRFKALSAVANSVFQRRSLSALNKYVEDEKAVDDILNDITNLQFPVDTTRIVLYREGTMFQAACNRSRKKAYAI